MTFVRAPPDVAELQKKKKKSKRKRSKSGAKSDAAARFAPDAATELQDGYEARALQQSARFTDDDSPTRRKALRKKFTAEDLDKDFSAYLGSGSSEELDEEIAKSRNAEMRSVFLTNPTEPAPYKHKSMTNSDEEMEVTWPREFKQEATTHDDETAGELAKKKKKKKRKSKKKRSKNAKKRSKNAK